MNQQNTYFDSVEFEKPSADKIRSSLLGVGFSITQVAPLPYGEQLHLGCGAVINVYNTGRVVVQGKVHPDVRPRVLSALKGLLPSDTRWGL